MGEAASRDFRNNTRALLARAEGGENITISVDGRPVAMLTPLDRRPQWVSRSQFIQRFSENQADSGLTGELRELAPDTTGDLPL